MIREKLKEWINTYRKWPLRAKASFWFLISSFLQKGISVITTPIFTRLLSTDEYGKYGVFNSWLNIVTIIVSMKLSAGVYTQGLVKFDDIQDQYTSSLQGLNFCLCAAWTAFYFLFNSFWNSLFSLNTVQVTSLLIMVWTGETFRFWMREQQVKLQYKRLVVLTLIICILKPLLGIVFVTNSTDKVTARILGLLIVELMFSPFIFIKQMRKGKLFFSKSIWKYALSFSLPLVPHYLSQIVLSSADRIMIENMIGPSEAGIYSLAYSISNIMVLFNTSFAQTLDPWTYQKIKENKCSEITKITYPSLVVIAALNLLLIAFAPEVVRVFAPPKYYDAIWVIPPVSMAAYFMFAYGLFAIYGFYFQKTRLIMLVSVAGAILNIILNYFFIRSFGYVAAGYTTLICYVLYTLGHYALMKYLCKRVGYDNSFYNTKTVIGISAAFVLIGFGFVLTYELPIIRYSVVGLFLLTVMVFYKKIKKTIVNILSLRKRE